MVKKSVNSDYQAVIKKETDKLYYELCLHREKWSKLNKGFWVWVEGTLMPTRHANKISRQKDAINKEISSAVNAFCKEVEKSVDECVKTPVVFFEKKTKQNSLKNNFRSQLKAKKNQGHVERDVAFKTLDIEESIEKTHRKGDNNANRVNSNRVTLGADNVTLTNAKDHQNTSSQVGVSFGENDLDGRTVKLQKSLSRQIHQKDLQVSPISDFEITKNGILKAYLGNDRKVFIPDNVKKIGERAFNESSVFEVLIPDSVLTIGKRAFQKCKNLKTVKLSNRLSCIEEGVFKGCKSLTEIVVPKNLTEIKDNAFEGCEGLHSIELSDCLTIIGYGAFSRCRALTDILLPESMIEIGSAAFYNCTSLTNIVIPNGVVKLGNCAFEGCISLKTVKLSNQLSHIDSDLFSNCRMLTNIEIPQGVLDINHRAFSNCSGLKRLVLPDTVINIVGNDYYGKNIFYGCDSLEKIVLKGHNKGALLNLRSILLDIDGNLDKKTTFEVLTHTN